MQRIVESAADDTIEFEILRNDVVMRVTVALEEVVRADNNLGLGISYAPLRARTPRMNLLGAIARGFEETIEILVVSVRGIRLLFQGLRFNDAVAGPIRLTHLVGDATAGGFQESATTGTRVFFTFLSILSIALCITNLLPIPVLDGGHILLASIELVTRRSIRPIIIYRYQLVGMAIVLVLLALTMFSDLLFLFRN